MLSGRWGVGEILRSAPAFGERDVIAQRHMSPSIFSLCGNWGDMRASRLVLPFSTMLASCAPVSEPFRATPPPSSASMAPVEAPPSACATGRALVEASFAAEREGRLVRAFRKLTWARATCPGLAASTADAASRVAAAMGPPWRDDAVGIERAKDDGEAYHGAARAFQAGKMVEAARGALAAALAGETYRTEGLLVAARSAEFAHDDARSRRMFARAYDAECASERDLDSPSQCALRPRMPRADLFAYAALVPGFRPWGPGCVTVNTVAGGEALSPDGSVALFATYPRLGVNLRLIPSRVLLGGRGLNASDFLCVGDGARTALWFGTNGRVEVGAPGGRLRTIDVPTEIRPNGTGFVAGDGAIFLPHFPEATWGGDWYRAGAEDTRLRRIPLPTQSVPPVLVPDGSLLGYQGKPDDRMPLARFDGKTGKRVEVIGDAGRGQHYTLMPDGKRVAYLLGDDTIAVVDPSAKTIVTSKRAAFVRPIGFSGPSRVLFAAGGSDQAVEQDLVTGVTIPRDVIARFGTLSCDAARQAVTHWRDFGGATAQGSASSAGPLPWSTAHAAALESLLYRELGLGAHVLQLDEHTETFVICTGSQVGLGRIVNGAVARLRITFTFGAMGGMAIDDDGYYEFFGDVPPGFRAASACGDEWPIEMCSDRFEAPGLLRKFARGDLSYREP